MVATAAALNALALARTVVDSAPEVAVSEALS